MRKSAIHSVLIALVIAVGFMSAAPARAEKFTSRTLTVEVPEGWTTDQLDTISEVIGIYLFSPDEKCSIAVTTLPSNGWDSRKAAEMFALTEGVPEEDIEQAVEQVPGRDSYRFVQKTDEADPRLMETTIFAHGSAALIWTQMGDTEKYADEIKAIWNSLSSSDPGQQAMLDALYKQR